MSPRYGFLLVTRFLFLMLFFRLQVVKSQVSSMADRPLALTGGTVYASPSEKPITNGVVVISDGKIVAVGPAEAVHVPQGHAILDCSGLTITAGLWNCHVHFFERKWTAAKEIPAPELERQLQDMLTRYGFTTVFDLGSRWENTKAIHDRIESGEVPGPGILSTGESLLSKESALPSDAVLRILGVMAPAVEHVANASESLNAAKKLLDRGSDGLKLHMSSQIVLPEEVIRSAVEEAHRRNRPVFAHPGGIDGLLAAVRGGVDIVAHSLTVPVNEVILKEMSQKGVALIPTLKIWTHHLRHDRVSLTDERVQILTGELKTWMAFGGEVLFGTDVGGMDDYDPSDEYIMMGKSGMTFQQILASLTTAPAGKFGASERLGRISNGYDADLVVLNADPAQDPQAFANVRYTIRNGKLICDNTIRR